MIIFKLFGYALHTIMGKNLGHRHRQITYSIQAEGLIYGE